MFKLTPHVTAVSQGRRIERGFGMIEVLVSIVVIAFGMLGLAAMQAAVAKQSTSTFYIDTAQRLAMDMSEKMRAYNAPPGPLSPFEATNPVATSACFTTAGCDSDPVLARSKMAATELKTFQDDVAKMLPSGTAVICRDSDFTDEGPSDGITGAPAANCDNNGTIFAIKIWWSDNRDATLHRYTLTY